MTANAIALFLPLLCLTLGCGDELRINHVQARGTEYSHYATDRLAIGPNEPLEFTHRPLLEQFAREGVRQVDISVTYHPFDRVLLARIGFDNTTDVLTQCDSLADCLNLIANWSRANRQHHPVTVVIQPNSWDDIATHLRDVEGAIAHTFQRWQIITPGEVAAGYPDLRTAITERGWPAIELSRGRTMFVLNDRGRTREAYLAGRFLDPDEPRLLFTVADSPDVPYAGVFSFPDVTAANQAQIRALVEQGYLVRAITNTEDAVQRAIDNGVHFLSTRYPDDLLPPDRLGGFPSGCNPVTTDETCEPSMIEIPPR